MRVMVPPLSRLTLMRRSGIANLESPLLASTTLSSAMILKPSPMSLRKTKSPYVRKIIGDGFRIIADDNVVLASKGDSKLAIPLRRIKVKRDKGGTITLITNDLERTAVEIAALYKGRWQIELLFPWIKQHPNLPRLIGNNRSA